MLIKIIIILIFIYLIGGIYKVVYDFRLASIDQPMYVRRFKLSGVIFAMIVWFPLLIMYVKTAGGITRYLKLRKGFKKRTKIEKLSKLVSRDPSKDNLNKLKKVIKDSKQFDKEVEDIVKHETN